VPDGVLLLRVGIGPSPPDMREDRTFWIAADPVTFTSFQSTKHLLVWLGQRVLLCPSRPLLGGFFRHTDTAHVG